MACPRLSEEPGGLLRSKDWGETWQRVDRGIAPKGAMYAVAVDPRNSAQIFCSTNKGSSTSRLDDGSSWKECSLPENVKRLSALAVGISPVFRRFDYTSVYIGPRLITFSSNRGSNGLRWDSDSSGGTAPNASRILGWL